MHPITKKLVSLNLALLMAALLIVPAWASETPAPRLDRVQAEYQSPVLDAEESVQLLNGYTIYVDNIKISSSADASGEGWSYDADNTTLTLNNYNGGEIYSEGDLYVDCLGENVITPIYRNSGVFANGFLYFWIYDGSLTVYGGSGSDWATDAAGATGQLTVYCRTGAEATFYGGNSGSDEEMAGCGLYSSTRVYLWGYGVVGAAGGRSLSSWGGDAIFSSAVEIDTDCVAIGGDGKYGGCGIYYTSSCELGLAEMIIEGGSPYWAAIAGSADASNWRYSIHTNITETDCGYLVRINEYTLTLYGNGGNSNGKTSISMTDEYPTYYQLGQYLFERDGYVQTSWATGSSLVPLNASYRPPCDDYLRANWLEVEAGEIVLNTLQHTFDGEEFVKKYAESVTLPDDLAYANENDRLLGWCSEVASTPATLEIYGGKWYEAGDVIEPSTYDAIDLYARTDEGTFAVYHPNGGTVRDGGAILVQGSPSTSSDLEVFLLNETEFRAPEGYALAGWATTPDACVAEFPTTGKLKLECATTNHLYAVWALSPEFGVQIAPSATGITCKMTSNWNGQLRANTVLCALYDGDRMVAAVPAVKQEDGSLLAELDIDSAAGLECRIFALNRNQAPLREAVTCILPDIF